MDDNVRPRRAVITYDFLEAEDIQRMLCPSMSPDLNSIQNVCDMLGKQLASRQHYQAP